MFWLQHATLCESFFLTSESVIEQDQACLGINSRCVSISIVNWRRAFYPKFCLGGPSLVVGKDTLESYSDCCLYSLESPFLPGSCCEIRVLSAQATGSQETLFSCSGHSLVNAIAVAPALWSGSLMEQYYPCFHISFFHCWVSPAPAFLML
jgi:hypothetical protein